MPSVSSVLGSLATYGPIVYLIYASHLTFQHISSLWELQYCDQPIDSRNPAQMPVCLCPAYDAGSTMNFVIFATHQKRELFEDLPNIVRGAELTFTDSNHPSIYEWESVTDKKPRRIQVLYSSMQSTNSSIPINWQSQDESKQQLSKLVSELKLDMCPFLSRNDSSDSRLEAMEEGLYLHLLAYYSELPATHLSGKKKANAKKQSSNSKIGPLNALSIFMYSVAPLTEWVLPDSEKKHLMAAEEEKEKEGGASNNEPVFENNSECAANSECDRSLPTNKKKNPKWFYKPEVMKEPENNAAKGTSDGQWKKSEDESASKESDKVLHLKSRIRWFWVNQEISPDRCLALERSPREMASLLTFKRQSLGFYYNRLLRNRENKNKKKSSMMHSSNELWYDPLIFRTPLTDLKKYSTPIDRSLMQHCLHGSNVTSTISQSLNVSMSVEGVSFGWLRLYAMLQGTMDNMRTQFGMNDESELDDIKALWVDTNPYLTLATMIVSLLHSIFSILAIKSDVDFWSDDSEESTLSSSRVMKIDDAPKLPNQLSEDEKRELQKRRNKEGLSLNSVMFECLSSFVIFVYLLDSRGTTSWLVLVFGFGECMLALWKMNRVMALKNRRKTSKSITENDGSDRKGESLDSIAARWMMYFMVPCLLGYAVYSLYYEKHKSVLSYCLHSAAMTVYGLGFIHLTPQLFINYQLKSVEFLPWKTLIYKFLNTFVDDLFSFVIDMPLLHRIACFRDDIVFFIFLYQWYIYGADKSTKKEDNNNNNKKNDNNDDQNNTSDDAKKKSKDEKKGTPMKKSKKSRKKKNTKSD